MNPKHLKALSGAAFRPMTERDYMCYAGVDGDASLAETDDYVIIVDAGGMTFIDENGSEHTYTLTDRGADSEQYNRL